MARVPCDLADILSAARQQLVTAGVITDARAWLTLDPDDMLAGTPEPPLAGVSFTAFDQRPDTLHVEQDPTDTPVMDGELVVALWTRVARDDPGKDTLALTDATAGMAALARKTFAALNNRDLTSGADTLTWRPLTFLGVKNRGRWKPNKDYRCCHVRFNATFLWRVA